MVPFEDVNSYGQGGLKVVIVTVLLIVTQFLVVGGRLTSRRLRKVGFGADDYVLLLATAFSLGLCAIAIAFPRIAGIDTHIGEIQMRESSEGKLLNQTFIAWMVIYGASIALSKSAILLLYIRVFTTRNRAFTVEAYLIGFVVVATGMINTCVTIFQCSPIAYEWNKSIHGGKCIDEVTFSRYIAISNVVTGAIMLIMPIPLVWKLNLKVSGKITLTATFLHGIIGFIASCARLSILFRTTDNNDSVAWTIWTINESANYIFAACLPTLRPLFLRILPSSFFILSKPQLSAQKVSPTPESPASDCVLKEERSRRRDCLRGNEHPSLYDECWVDMEASRPSIDDSTLKVVTTVSEIEIPIISRT